MDVQPQKESNMGELASIEKKRIGIKLKVLNSIKVIKKWTRPDLLTTGGLYIHVLAWGVYCGALSSTLLDLEQLTSSTTAQVGLMFTSSTLGALVGAPVGGQILARVDCRIVLSVVCACFGITISILPWARNFVQLIAFATINGLFQGALDTAQNISGLLIWGWDGFVYMQGFHGTFAIGTFIGPLLAKPFLAPTWYEPYWWNSTNTNGSYADAVTITPADGLNTTSNDNVTSLATTKLVMGESKAMYVYMIIGIYLFLSGVVYFIIYLVTRGEVQGQGETSEKGRKKKKPKEDPEAETRNPNQKKLWYVIPMTLMASVRFGAYVGLELTFSGFLMTYVVKGLGWEKSEGLGATTLYWGSFAASRILSTFGAMCISPTIYVMSNMSLMIIAYLGMVLFVRVHSVVILVCSVMTGIAQGSFYGCSMSWASKYMLVTERIGSAFTTGSWIGVAVLPALAGHLIDNVSPDAFLYMCLFDAILIASVTVVSTIMGFKFGAPLKKGKSVGTQVKPPQVSHVTAC